MNAPLKPEWAGGGGGGAGVSNDWCILFVLCYNFHPGDVAEWSFLGDMDTYGSCLLTQANISRLGLCLERIALKHKSPHSLA